MCAMLNEDLWYGSDADEDAKKRAAASLAARVGRVLGAKPFPASALRLARLTRDPSCNIDDLQAVLETDPALSARLLRLVNSAGFALRTECSSVRHAAALVGNSRLNQLATTAAIVDMYDSSAKHAAAVLEHMSVVGALSRYLAYYFALPADDVFTCGFMHDLGKLMLLETDGGTYEELLDAAGQEPDALHLLERSEFGFDHAQLAGHVLSNWSIPEPVPQVVAWHHSAAHAFTVSAHLGQMVSALRLADHMSYAFRSYYPEEEIERLAKTDAAAYLDVSEAQLAAMWDEMAALAMRVARASRSGAGVPETFGARPSAANLRAVRKERTKKRVQNKPKPQAPAPAPEEPPTPTSSSGEIPAIVSLAPERIYSPTAVTVPEELVPNNVVIFDAAKAERSSKAPKTVETEPDAERTATHAPEQTPVAGAGELSLEIVDSGAGTDRFRSIPPANEVDASADPDLAAPSKAATVAGAQPAESNAELAGDQAARPEQPATPALAPPAPSTLAELLDESTDDLPSPKLITVQEPEPKAAIPEPLEAVTTRGLEMQADVAAFDEGSEPASLHPKSPAAPPPAALEELADNEVTSDSDPPTSAPTRLQPSPPQSIQPHMAADSPRQFACVVCRGPTYAASCEACGGYVCPEHQNETNNWCTSCCDAFTRYKLPMVPPLLVLGVGSGYGLLVASFAFVSSGSTLGRTISTVAVAAALAMVVGIARGAYRKARFLRHRKERHRSGPVSLRPMTSRHSALASTPDAQTSETSHGQAHAEEVLARIEPNYDRASLDRLLLAGQQNSLLPHPNEVNPPDDRPGQLDGESADEAPQINDLEAPPVLSVPVEPDPGDEQMRIPTGPNSASPRSLRPSARPSAMNLARRSRQEQHRFRRAMRKKGKSSSHQSGS